MQTAIGKIPVRPPLQIFAMSVSSLLTQIELSLASSNAEQRKFWAREIKRQELKLNDFLPILHGQHKTAQRFTWLITDIAEVHPPFVIEALPLLFSLRDDMPFSGMHRSVAKWLQMTGVPKSVEKEAIPQLLEWVANDQACIASKSFAAKALVDLVAAGRLERQLARDAIATQMGQGTPAFSARMVKLLEKLESLPSF